jgi:hypothetical protein
VNFLSVSFNRRASSQQKEAQKPQAEQKPNETSCAVCHRTYGPQGESEEEYATKPPQARRSPPQAGQSNCLALIDRTGVAR